MEKFYSSAGRKTRIWKRCSLKPSLCPTGNIREQLIPICTLILAPFLPARGNPQIIINKRMQKEIVMDQVLNYASGDSGLIPISAGDFSGDLGLPSLCFSSQWMKPGVSSSVFIHHCLAN